MAIPSVPPATQYSTSGSQRRTEPRSFADLYEQARRAQGNDNNTEQQEQAIKNDLADREQRTETNRKYIDALHERVETLRGELLVRVIQSSGAPKEEAQKLSEDISRLGGRLNGLRKKLHDEEQRLSGKLIDVSA